MVKERGEEEANFVSCQLTRRLNELFSRVFDHHMIAAHLKLLGVRPNDADLKPKHRLFMSQQ
jgi:hypothetical protein